MSTRSVVAYRTEEGGWRGRYIHFDGYPEHMTPALTTIIQRDGFAKAKAVLCDEHTAWSMVDPDRMPDVGYLGSRGEAVDGYGTAYTATESDYWYSSDRPEDLSPWIEWLHILEEDGTVTSTEVTA